MAEIYTIKKETLDGIGDAIRTKTGETELIPPEDMPDKIKSITTGSGETVETVIGQIVNNVNYFIQYQPELGSVTETNKADITISPVKGSLIHCQYSLSDQIKASVTISGGLELVANIETTNLLYLITGDFTITFDMPT